jgi:tRNA (Thr-GGU) A37 N-methylase
VSDDPVDDDPVHADRTPDQAEPQDVAHRGPTPIVMVPIGKVVGGRSEAIDDHWEAVEATIELAGDRLGVDATAGLAGFSHLEVVFLFHKVADVDVEWGARHPRGRADWPAVGILAQRAKNRPNRIGVSVCRLLAVDGLELRVQGLDAVDETPVLDVKPYMPAFGPRGPVRQPPWVEELMRDYW